MYPSTARGFAVYRLTSCILLSGTILTAAPAVMAQAPKVTAKGDPSVRDDTIYALAADPAARQNQLPLVLLEDVIIRLEADGRHTRTVRTVVQVLREPDIARFADQSVSYGYDHEGLTINWMRVHKSTGELISDKQTHPSEIEPPLTLSSPHYTRERVHRILSSGIAVGTIVDFSYTKEEKRPYRASDHFFRWTLGNALGEVKRTRFIYDVPASVQPVITEHDITFKPVVTENGGRRTYVWAAQNVPRFAPEPFAPDSLSRIPRVLVSLPGTWAAIGKWYAALGRGQYDVDGGEERGRVISAGARLKTAVMRARSMSDTIRMIHKWLAQHPTSPVPFGTGPYRIRVPIEIIADGAADAKEKVHVFIGSLMKMKVEAFPVLAHSAGLADPRNPSVQQFNTVIAAVKNADGSYVFTDVTSGATRYGDLPLPLHGSFALLVKPNGDVEEVHLPGARNADRKSETVITATLSDSGTASGTISDVRTGHGWEGERQRFGIPVVDSARRAAFGRQHLTFIPGARADDVSAFDRNDLNALISYTTTFSGGRLAVPASGGHMLTVPVPPLPASPFLAMLQRSERKHPFDANRTMMASATTQELILTLPPGWKARVPATVTVASDFGKYSATYAQIGQVLRIVRTMEPGQGVFPASRMPDVVAWLTAIRADEANRTILLEHPPR